MGLRTMRGTWTTGCLAGCDTDRQKNHPQLPRFSLGPRNVVNHSLQNKYEFREIHAPDTWECSQAVDSGGASAAWNNYRVFLASTQLRKHAEFLLTSMSSLALGLIAELNAGTRVDHIGFLDDNSIAGELGNVSA